MCPTNEQRWPILAAEADPKHARDLLDCLALLDIPARLVTSGGQLLAAIRREMFRSAIVAAEMNVDGEPAMACLSRLPSLRCLIVLGQDAEAETRARLCGATLYLPRPPSAGALAEAIRMPMLTAMAGADSW